MKKENIIYESQGIVDKDGIQWNDLADLITEYIYDLKHGLNADPFYNGENAIITKGNIESYYQYIHSKRMPNYIIPNWIGSFDIHLATGKTTKGTFLQKEAKLNNDNKLVFTIEARNSMDSPDALCNTFVHELQHAYSTWIQLTKNIRFHNRKGINMYIQSTKAFSDEKYGGSYHPMVLQKFTDYLEINDEIFTNPLYLERTLLSGFYYSDIDEMRSFIQEYANDMMKKLKGNIRNIQNYAKSTKNFDFNDALSTFNVNYYDSKYYKTYKSYYIFYKKLQKMNIDEDVAYAAIKGSSKAIRTFLEIPPTKKIVQFSGDENKILQKIAKKQIPIFERVLKKMQKIFNKLITEMPI